MKRSTLIFSIVCLTAAIIVIVRATSADAPPTTTPTLATSNPTTMDTHLADASYGIGFNMGQQLAQAPFKVDEDRLVQGLRDARAGKPSAVSDAQLHAAMEKLKQDAALAGEAKARAAGDPNVTAGDAYRAANGKKAGVTTTASGLQIETLTAGTGETPKATDKVKVHYVGTLIDGTKFDSSIDRGEPIVFGLDGVIKGWGEGLQLMKVGGKARLVIPPSLGYGADGSGTIPPYATLVFEVQLISIEK
jgi:FKBP-type peptidyl-prolyl cis-trans isomerase FkpA